MGLSKPLPRRKVDKMKTMPRREKIDVTLSAIIKALTWLGVAWTAMMGFCFAEVGQVRALDSVKLSAEVGVVVACKARLESTVVLVL